MNMKRILALTCVLAMLLSMLAGCGDPTDTTGSQTTAPQPGTTAPKADTVSYTVTLKSVTGIALSNVTLYVYTDKALTDLQNYGVTNDDGIAVIELPAGGDYHIVVSNAPEGYVVEASYPFTGTSAEIVLQTQIVADTNVVGVKYTLGSVMRDIEFTDTNGVTYKLSDVLKEKELVMLNFWYTTCSYCVEEFPYMEAAYQQYKDKMEIFALNPTGESMQTNKNFKESMGLSFPFGDDTAAALFSAFNGQGCPTSVFIDRYGMVCLVEVGGIPSETTFARAFEHFTAENYTQTLFNSISELTPVQKPTAQMPSSEEMGAAINSGDITVTYAPETEGADAEMSWPFIIGEKDGQKYIYPSNVGVDSSYATLYADVTLKAGEALCFDYMSSCESGMDVMYVLMDREDVYQISGVGTGWNSCYPFVATEDGEYELALCFLKDESDAEGDDTVYIKNMRVVPVDQIDAPTYIPRYAANHLKEDGFGYESYAEVFFNEADGYYHVGSVNGPLLLANLMGATRFSNDTVYSMAYVGDITVDGVNYYDQLLPYFSMASNSEIYGMATVNQELALLLQMVTKAVGIEQSENEWLQICEYYDCYGGAVIEDPNRGLSAGNAMKAEMGKTNYVTYNRVIMPRGLLFAFTPTQSGVYRITTDSEHEVDGWVFLADNINDRSEYYTYEREEKMYFDPLNISMVLYMEAGTTYYIDVAYYDVYQTGTIGFDIKYEGATLDLFQVASPGYFTFYEDDTGATVNGGIDVALGDDGYYHELRPDGTLGSILYADFRNYTGIFTSTTLTDMANNSKAFDFSLSEADQLVLDYIANFKTDDYEAEFKALWGEDYEANMEIHQVEDVLDGIYHGEEGDCTDIAKKYAAMAITGKAPELEGCVAVTEELAEVLQALMDKFTFEGVEHSWTKLCYYYKHFSPADPI